MGTHPRADGLFAGCLVGLLTARAPGPRGRWARRAIRGGAYLAAAVLVAHVLRAAISAPYVYHGGLTLINLCTALVIVALVWAPPRLLAGVLRAPGLPWLGRISYSLYLWHIPVYLLVQAQVRGAGPWVWAALGWACSLGAAALSHYAVERPFLRLKDRLPRGQGSPARAPERTPVPRTEAA
jgi:peptidoglycan/LPS O-acetylase OafA/YrhL